MRLTVYSEATSVGGAELVLGDLIAELDSGIEVSVLAVDQGVAQATASRRPGTPATLLRAPGSKADVRAMAAHVRALRRQRPEILQVNLQTPWVGQHGILAGLLGRCPTVAVEHLPFPSRSRLQRSTRRALCSRLAAHVAVGERAARRTEEVIGLRPGSVETIYNGVPDLHLKPLPRAGSGPTIGAMGRFSPQKGFDLLVRALARLPVDVTCVLVGDGPERGNLERLAEELGIRDRTAFTGWVERPRDYLPGFDVVAMPSRFEGLGLVAIEAALAERPVVAAAVDGIPDAVVDGATGILVPPEDPVALAEAISALLGDASRREEMGLRARARALERFSLTTMARSYEQLYRRLLSSRRGRRTPRPDAGGHRPTP
jgi:glycosyltransferase involved in cell wall biosynthesis